MSDLNPKTSADVKEPFVLRLGDAEFLLPPLYIRLKSKIGPAIDTYLSVKGETSPAATLIRAAACLDIVTGLLENDFPGKSRDEVAELIEKSVYGAESDNELIAQVVVYLMREKVFSIAPVTPADGDV